MPRANPIQTNFTGGELSPALYSRVDTEKYQNGAKTLENMIVVSTGGAKKRAGSKFVWYSAVSGARSRLVPFSYNAEQNYVLEFSVNKIRFFSTQAIVTLTAQNITGISQTNPAVLTYSGSDTFNNGDSVVISGVTGMTEVNNREFTVANVNAGANTFELSGVDATGYTAYSAGGTVAEILEVTTTYSSAEVLELSFSQSADTLFIFHENHAPAMLVRNSATSWTLSDMTVLRGPWRTLNTENSVTLKANDYDGSVTVVASAATFDALHVGAKYKIYSPTRSAGQTEWGDTADVDADDIWTYNGNVYYIPAVGGATSGSTKYNPPTHKSGTVRVYQSGTFTNYADVRFMHQGFGIVTITAVTSSTEADGTVYSGFGYEELPREVVDPAMTGGVATNDWYREPSKFWQEGAWSSYRGWPERVTFFEQRLVSSKGQTIYGSVSGTVNDFEEGANDDQALNYTLASDQADYIRWLNPGKQLIIGTTGGEYVLGASSLGEAVTPKNIKISRETSYGSAPCEPVRVGNAVLFMQRRGDPDNAGRIMREMAYSFEIDGYLSNNLTIFSQHITGDGVTDLAYQADPDSLVWGVRTDGAMCCLSYQREHQVTAWHRHILGGTSTAGGAAAVVEDVVCIPGADGDELWLKVKRYVGGATVRYIEVLSYFDDDTAKEDGIFVDSAISYSGASAATLTGLWHLRGATVKYLANGTVGSGTVSATGNLTLAAAATKVHIGYSYTAKAESLDYEAGAAAGTSQGRQKRISNVTLRLHRSVGGSAGISTSHDAIRYDDQTTPTALFTGDRPVVMPSGWDSKCSVYVEHSDPTPFMVLAIMPELSTTG